MLVLSLALLLTCPQTPQDWAVVRARQQQRTEVVARVSPAVCAVMPVGTNGGGSGVIIDPAGFVLTNFHVVQRRQKKNKAEEPAEEDVQDKEPDADGLPAERFGGVPADDDRDNPAWAQMKVGLPDGELYLADVLGIDPGSDLAILLLRPRPDGKPYPAAGLGDSDALLVGETVFAMGNPFLLATDFVPTVTWGVVSGTHRYQPGGANRFLVYPDCIQVDAPVNPGNSGGPLFTAAGEVVGINGRITVRDRGRVNTGVGFAIASNQIRQFLGDLLAGRHAEHGTLDLNAWFMNSLAEKRRGVFVQATFADSQAAVLGVGPGDELKTFNGAAIRSANQLATLVGVLPAGSWVTLGYRPFNERNETFGPSRDIVFQLTRLDTGSSRDEDRLASLDHRRLAARVLSRQFGVGEPLTAGCDVVIHLLGDQRLRLRRRGDQLRWDEVDTALVAADGAGFAERGGVAADLTAEERARLSRCITTNPLLWSGEDRARMIADADLRGGVLVFGEPAYRFGLPGDGQREVFLYTDGVAAGCNFRDPVAKARVEYRFDRAARRVRIVVDGELETDAALAVSTVVPTADVFERPSR